MVLHLYGNDSFRLQERLLFLREAFRAKYDERGHHIVDIDAATSDIDTIRQHLRTAGLFSAKRFVIIRNLEHVHKEIVEQLAEEFRNVPEDTICCLVSEKEHLHHSLQNVLQKIDKREEYQELNVAQLRTFIRTKVSLFRATIDDEAIDKLATSIGNDLWRQYHEIKKLAHYTTHIRVVDVQEFVSDPLDDNIFHLTDALGMRNAKQVSELLEQQFSAGVSPQYLLAMLDRHLAVLYRVAVTNGQGLSLHPFVIQKAYQHIQHFSVAQLAIMCWQLVETDMYLKSHRTDPRVVLTTVLMAFCVARTSEELRAIVPFQAIGLLSPLRA